ncbi:extracellular solute-binding protein [Kineothrix sp. MB12-C1]|uniref:extracellular solute-binding protein n=1 Tax=Kineothrix sp. MB12-C1 TaxID=3070215 RepID=UPI0027D2712C|nr:extracellular solute-binding protein [Kineothrix sp. MB12-C1]WMC93639.1 extracellular solute-binding protein [Kineothrix sp. MB12-C1]
MAKRAVALFLAMVTSFSLMACSGSSTGTNQGAAADSGAVEAQGEETAEEQVSVAPGKKGSIEFWTVFTGADGSSMQAIVDAYNATNPDYTVNHRAIEANDLYLKMPLAIQSATDVPDVAINHVERIPLFQEMGLLDDYNEVLADSNVKPENYNPKAWTMTELAGGHYGIPLDVHSFSLYVNMDLYEKYGNGSMDDGVLTWDEVKEAGEACLADEIIPIGMTWQRVMFLSSYAQLGGTLSTDGSVPDFNNDKAKQVFDTWTELEQLGYTNKDGDDPWQLFLGGKMLYCPEGIWMYNNVRETGLNAKMFDYPVFEPGTKGNWTSSHQFVLPKNPNRDAEKTQAVLAFIDYLGNNGLEWAKAGQVPAHVAIKEVAEFKDMPQAFFADENEELKIYDYKYYGYAVEALDKITGEVLFGRMTAEDALNQAVQETKGRIEMGE